MIYIGIDPGLNGAICFFNPKEGHLYIEDMPTVEVTRSSKKKKEVSPQLLHQLFNNPEKQKYTAILERVGAMPGQGVSSVFSFGRSVGIVEGILAAHEIPVTIVPPRKWQDITGVRGGKDGSRQRAAELFPAFAHYFTLKKHDGRSDAALMAWYGATM